MKLTRILFYTFILFTLSNCKSDWDLSELYIERIENTSKVIYKYDAWGGRDSHIFGYTILDSTEIFDINNVVPLNFYLFEDIPSKNLILTIDSDNSDYTKTANEIHKPLKIVINQLNNIKIETKIFQYKGFANRTGGLGRYEFEKFKETHDSVFFYNLDDVESMKSEHLERIKFKKTNIAINKDSLNNITKITIEDLKLSKSGEILSNITYYLKPKGKININEFSEVGIFKELNAKK